MHDEDDDSVPDIDDLDIADEEVDLVRRGSLNARSYS